MKRISIYALTVLAAAILTAACTHDLPDTSKSVISQGEIATNDFDKWLEVNYVEPYNINFQYR